MLKRDGYRCAYPGCRVRRGLHVHHAEPRSRFGRKRLAERDAESNLITTCWFHHRAVHQGVIEVKGTAPDGLEWRRPPLMETASQRHEKLSPIDAEFLADGDAMMDDAAGSQRWDREVWGTSTVRLEPVAASEPPASSIEEPGSGYGRNRKHDFEDPNVGIAQSD